MALVLKDRVQEVSTTSGTGTLTLTGAVSGFQTFSTAIGNGNTTYYTIFDNTAYVWEVGIGTVGAGTLARTTVLANSSGTTSPLNLAGNTIFVFCTYPAERSINYDADNVATIGSTLGYSDTGIIASFASTVAGYNQVILQNKSTATNASTNFNVSNDAGTAGSNYAELGINSSTFTGSGSFNIAGASYVASASTDLTLGTYGAYSIHFVTNSSTTDAMTIFNNGGISLGGFSNPGIGNMAASKFVPGYTSVTAAAGTTTLTASSDYYQNLVGTTTQTFQLPDATGLLEGTTFIFDNDSTGTLTVVDNASGSIETVPSGAASFVYLADNATVAGTWRRHAFLPASYDFNSSTANFGNATIINAVWNGTTISTAYGGTGLSGATPFTAANNALYSSNATTLVAGTLPIQAGGTAKTTFTANGVVYGDGTNPLGVTAAGTTGQVLIATTGSAPSWGAIPTTAAVTSFQTSLSGLTPSTATTGAVTLAGTLGVGSGGTGTATSFTTGSVVFAGASGVYSQDNANLFWDDSSNRLGIGTSAPSQKVTISSNTVLPSAGAPITSNIWSVGADGVTNVMSHDSFGIGTSFIARRSNGTAASPTALAADNNIFQFAARGYGATGYSSGGRAQFAFLASENWSDTAQGTYITFNTTLNGTTTNTERMRIDNAGNVGIGTTSPGYRLHVQSGTATYSVVSTSGGIIANVGASDAAGFAQFGTVSNTPIILQTNNTERMRIDTSGNVGIGTTSPVGKLNVIGGLGVGAALTGDNAITPLASGGIVISGGNQASLQTYTSVGSATTVGALNYYAAIDQSYNRFFDIAAYGSTTGSTGNIRFLTGSSTSTERMRIDGSGNVGIGNNNPSYPLHVNKNSAANNFLASFGNTDTGATSGAAITVTQGVVTAQLQAYGNNTVYFGSQTNHPVAIQTNSAERMRIDSSGNVGIGTTSPGAILHTIKTSAGAATVGAFLQNSDNTTSTEVRLAFSSNTNSLAQDRYGWIGYVNSGGTNSGSLTFATTPGGQAATERMRITANGGISFGSSGTAYGTSGQVLQSNGDAAPTWVTPASSGLTVGTTSITSGTSGYILYNNAGTLGNLNVSGSGNVVLATSPTVSGVTLNDGYTEEVFPIPTSTNPALSPTNGSIQTWTLTGTSTPTAGTWAAGQSLTLMIDDGTTAFTISWASTTFGPSGVNWVGGLAPSLATTGYTVIELWKVGTQVYGALVGNVAA